MKLKSLCGRFSERKNWEGPQYVHCGSTSWNCYLRYQSSRQCPRMTFRNSTISRDPCSAFFRSSGLQSSGGHIPFLLPQNDETKAVTSRSSLYQAPWLRSPRHLIKRRPCAEVWSFYTAACDQFCAGANIHSARREMSSSLLTMMRDIALLQPHSNYSHTRKDILSLLPITPNSLSTNFIISDNTHYNRNKFKVKR